MKRMKAALSASLILAVALVVTGCELPADRSQERYLACVENGGNYVKNSWTGVEECRLPGSTLEGQGES